MWRVISQDAAAYARLNRLLPAFRRWCRAVHVTVAVRALLDRQAITTRSQHFRAWMYYVFSLRVAHGLHATRLARLQAWCFHRWVHMLHVTRSVRAGYTKSMLLPVFAAWHVYTSSEIRARYARAASNQYRRTALLRKVGDGGFITLAVTSCDV